MSIEAYGLQDIKKELQHLSGVQLTELCLRLARYRKENKELLAYLLFIANDEAAFIEQSKYEVSMMFYMLPSQAANTVKVLRKTLRLITKLSRFAGSKHVEITLLLGFCNNYLEYIDKRVSYKPLRTIFLRQVVKTAKLINKLHEELQDDYANDYNAMIDDADKRLNWFSKFEHLL